MNTQAFYLIVTVYTIGVYCSPYHGPTAKPVVLHNGYLADTHEVAAAKNAHLTALGQQHSSYEGSYSEEHTVSHGDINYHGPTAIPHVLHDGYLADTHEVAETKNAHLTALGQQHSSYEGNYNEDHTDSHGDINYHGPTAIPHVLHDGHIADTHEVAAAKAEHLAEIAKAKAQGDHFYGEYTPDTNAKHGDYHHVTPYHGPLAKPVVLKSGYLADTHEVVAARTEHLAEIAKAKAQGDHFYGEYTSDNVAKHGDYHHEAPYHGPLAKPVVLKSGYLADTEEVVAARTEHLSEVAKAKAHSGHGNDFNGEYTPDTDAKHGDYHHVTPYHGSLAKPMVLKSGYLADTHEVAAAKQHHLEVFQSSAHYATH